MKIRISFLAIVTLILGLNFTPSTASADSCWWHNGSLMRLVANGNQRYFYYERPRASLASAGIRPGTLLFNGRNSGGWYSGTARVFSSACPGQPLQYYVEGPVASNQVEVVMRGQRQIYRQCAPTGQYTTDRLLFTYSHQC